MKILWLSRHNPLPVQEVELRRLFGDAVEICRDVCSFQDAKEVARRFEEGSYDDLVVVAPLWVILRLTELGIRPLWAEMEQIGHHLQYDFCYRGRYYRFVRFRRIVAVNMVFEDFD